MKTLPFILYINDWNCSIIAYLWTSGILYPVQLSQKRWHEWESFANFFKSFITWIFKTTRTVTHFEKKQGNENGNFSNGKLSASLFYFWLACVRKNVAAFNHQSHLFNLSAGLLVFDWLWNSSTKKTTTLIYLLLLCGTYIHVSREQHNKAQKFKVCNPNKL